MFQSRARQTTCFDLFIGSTGRDEIRFDDYLYYIDANIPVREAYQYQIYRGENLLVTDYIMESADYWSVFDYDTLMRASDYATLRAMLGYPAVELEPGQYRIHCMPYLEELMRDYDQPITVSGRQLSLGGVCTESFTQSLRDGNGRGFLLVVPDGAAESRPIRHSIYAAMGGIFDPGALAGPGQLLAIVGGTLGLFSAIYFLYILMACESLKRNALPA